MVLNFHMSISIFCTFECQANKVKKKIGKDFENEL